jgi:hypothetical protein
MDVNWEDVRHTVQSRTAHACKAFSKTFSRQYDPKTGKILQKKWTPEEVNELKTQHKLHSKDFISYKIPGRYAGMIRHAYKRFKLDQTEAGTESSSPS